YWSVTGVQTCALPIFAQVLALIPGVSRSGVTITAGLFRGMTRLSAAQYSFLLSAPLIAGAVAKKLIDVVRDGLPPGQTTPFAVRSEERRVGKECRCLR